MPAIIELQELARSFGSTVAVKGVTFEIGDGELFSLLGPNGAGKTTTISMLSCLIQPTSGDARVAGHSIITESLAVRRLIGVVPQEIALYDTLSARENLAFWGSLYDLHGPALRKRIDAVLEIAGLRERAGDRIATFSGGMKRRINIAVGLLHEPRIVFMDEPTVGIDPQSRRAILDAVKEMNRSGLTVLYTTHYMEEAQELADRVGIIDHGELIAIGSQQELTDRVGSHETVRLHLADEASGEALAADLRQRVGIFEASAVDHEVVLRVAHADEAVAPAIVRAGEMGFKVRSVDLKEPDLEDVFLALTGRDLRD